MIIMIIIIMPGGVAPGKAGHAKVIGGAIRREFDENSPTRGRTGGRKASNRIINIIPRGRFEVVSRTISRTLGLSVVWRFLGLGFQGLGFQGKDFASKW